MKNFPLTCWAIALLWCYGLSRELVIILELLIRKEESLLLSGDVEAMLTKTETLSEKLKTAKFWLSTPGR
jgi:hypothetical protein